MSTGTRGWLIVSIRLIPRKKPSRTPFDIDVVSCTGGMDGITTFELRSD